jgi:adenine-specific DNA-methyltransferase
MNKMKMHSPDLTRTNIDKLAELFPNCLVESRDEKGAVTRNIDFDQLRQEVTGSIVEGPQERYQLNWPGKREALLTANAPIAKTLRPCREESVDFDTTQNLFIEGDNLDALKLLQETYLNKVKMIYIDPPYNTGNDFLYADDFSEDAQNFLIRSNQKNEAGERLIVNSESNGRFHSDWLSMIYPRLRLARNLLAEDGLILISIDDHEVSQLRAICDEVFGHGNFVECLIWKRRYGGGAKEKHIVSIHEYVLIYAREISAIPEIFIDLSDEQVVRYYKLKDENFEKFGAYRLQPLEPAGSMADRPNLRFSVLAPDGSEVWPARQWLWGKEKFAEARERGILDFKNRDGKWQVSRKQYLRDPDGSQRKTKQISIIDGIYGQGASAELGELFGDKNIFLFPKPSALIKHLIGLVGDDGIMLDFFSGSGSSANAVFDFNAENATNWRFIQVQLPEKCEESSSAFLAGYRTIADLSKERIRRAGTRVKANSPAIGQPVDTGFRVLKIDSSNMKEVFYTPDAVAQDQLFDQVNNIREDRTAEDLLFQVLLDWGVDLALPIAKEAIAGKTVYFVDGNALTACFDEGVSEDFVKLLAKREPLRMVFRDASFATDSVKINVEQIFKLMSPSTEVKTI